jgi:hypothetical protein
MNKFNEWWQEYSNGNSRPDQQTVDSWWAGFVYGQVIMREMAANSVFEELGSYPFSISDEMIRTLPLSLPDTTPEPTLG